MSEALLDNCWKLEVEMSVSGSLWRNSIEVSPKTGLTGVQPHPDPTASVVTAFINFMEAIHFPDTTIVQATLREEWQVLGTPVPTIHPPLWVRSVGVTGTADVTFGGAHNAAYLPKDAAIFAKKLTTGGKAGKMFLRNILSEADVQSALSGQWSFFNHAGGFQQSIFDAQAVTSLGPFCTGVPSGGGNYCFAIAHLMRLTAPGDTRAAYFTYVNSLVSQRPVWNKSQR